MSGTPDWKPDQLARAGAGKKPYRRKVAGRKRWEQIRDAKLGPCVICTWLGVKQELPSSLHHAVPKDRGGADCESNCVPVCGDGTRGHHGRLEAGDPQACQAFAAAIQEYDGDAYSYAVEKLGEDGFLRLYRVRFEAA